jgi:hypothetical protein
MNCSAVKKLISPYLDGRLDVEEYEELQDHVSSCPACEKDVRAYRRSWEMLGQWGDIQPEPGYVARFWTAVSNQVPWYKKMLEVLRPGFFPQRLSPAFIAVMILIVTGIFSLRAYWQAQESEQFLACLSEDEWELVENIELAEDFELIEDMDFFEDMEIIENLDSLVS